MANDVKIPQNQLDVNSFSAISQEQNQTIGGKMLDNGYVQLFASDKSATPPTSSNAASQQLVAKHMLFEAIENTYSGDVANQLFSSDGAGAALFSDKPLTSDVVNNLMMKAEALAQKIDQTQVETDEIVETKPKSFAQWLSSLGEWISNKLEAILEKALRHDEAITKDDLKNLDKKKVQEEIKKDLIDKSENGKNILNSKDMEKTAVETIIKEVNKKRGGKKNDDQPNKPTMIKEQKTPVKKDKIAVDDSNEDKATKAETNLPIHSNYVERSDVDNLRSYLADYKGPKGTRFENLVKKAIEEKYPNDDLIADAKFIIDNLDKAKALKFVLKGFEITKKVDGEEDLAKKSRPELDKMAINWLGNFMDEALDEMYEDLDAMYEEIDAMDEELDDTDRFNSELKKLIQKEVDADMEELKKTLGPREYRNVRAHKEKNVREGIAFLKEIREQEDGTFTFALDLARDKDNKDRLSGGRLIPESWNSNLGVKHSDIRLAVMKEFAKQREDTSQMSYGEKLSLIVDAMRNLIQFPKSPNE